MASLSSLSLGIFVLLQHLGKFYCKNPNQYSHFSCILVFVQLSLHFLHCFKNNFKNNFGITTLIFYSLKKLQLFLVSYLFKLWKDGHFFGIANHYLVYCWQQQLIKCCIVRNLRISCWKIVYDLTKHKHEENMLCVCAEIHDALYRTELR